MIKILKQIRETSQHRKGCNGEHAANIILNAGSWEAFPFRSRQECLLSPILFKIVLDILTTISRHTSRKGEGVIVYRETPKDPTLRDYYC